MFNPFQVCTGYNATHNTSCHAHAPGMHIGYNPNTGESVMWVEL